ncbi:hypothetical protein L6164_011725 [Bauhinia variegata]|uniref:Uncharacterized protein n=1 Tax=Bauhinia variegata TaxID=167791 RepID=A0ACB9P7Q0_BAUVA|nr:hypothetical protein L6164_011725 [Bauhinia variegata]
MMIPSYRCSLSSAMPLDLNEDQNHLVSPTHQASSSSSSLSYPVVFNPDHEQDQARSCYWEVNPSQSDEEAEKTVPSSGSWDHPAEEKDESKNGLKLKLWNKEDGTENDKADEEDGSLKWLPSKIRIIRKMMMGSDQRCSESSDTAVNSMNKFEDQTQPSSPPAATEDNSSNITSHNSNITVRVCADCHTTKTPLWRSGPRGPKSLCNACGIRQRKARRAMAVAAASENGTILAAETSSAKGNPKLHQHNKEKKLKGGRAPQMKRKRKLKSTAKPICRGRKKFSFEDFAIKLSNNLALQQLVFPQDEKEAAILLMSLSYGLLHG